MTALILGLVVFLGLHSLRIVAPGWRDAQLARRGENGWKGLYSVASGVGLVLIIWGYGAARLAAVDLWLPPLWTRHLAALLMLPAFILLTAAYVPGTRIKAALHHPMLLGVKVWALAHLLANGRLADGLLFGGFLVWAVLDYRSARGRDRAAGTVYPAGSGRKDVVAIVIGSVAWVVFSVWGHAWLIGVRPF